MVYACRFLVMCFHWHGDFPRLLMVLSLPLFFLDSYGVVGVSTCCFLIGAQVPYGCGLSY